MSPQPENPLRAIVDDYIHYYRDRVAREMRFNARQRTLSDAVVVARCVLPGGRRHNHQRRIRGKALNEARKRLLAADTAPSPIVSSRATTSTGAHAKATEDGRLEVRADLPPSFFLIFSGLRFVHVEAWTPDAEVSVQLPPSVEVEVLVRGVDADTRLLPLSVLFELSSSAPEREASELAGRPAWSFTARLEEAGSSEPGVRCFRGQIAARSYRLRVEGGTYWAPPTQVEVRPEAGRQTFEALLRER